jgi:hypothetical protein
MHPRRLEACATVRRHGDRLQPGLMQRDMWVMYSPLGAGIPVPVVPAVVRRFGVQYHASRRDSGLCQVVSKSEACTPRGCEPVGIRIERLKAQREGDSR